MFFFTLVPEVDIKFSKQSLGMLLTFEGSSLQSCCRLRNHLNALLATDFRDADSGTGGTYIKQNTFSPYFTKAGKSNRDNAHTTEVSIYFVDVRCLILLSQFEPSWTACCDMNSVESNLLFNFVNQLFLREKCRKWLRVLVSLYVLQHCHSCSLCIEDDTVLQLKPAEMSRGQHTFSPQWHSYKLRSFEWGYQECKNLQPNRAFLARKNLIEYRSVYVAHREVV